MDMTGLGAVGTLLTAWAGGIWMVTEVVSGRVKALPYGHHLLPWLPIIIGALSALVYFPTIAPDLWPARLPWPHQMLLGAAAGAFACKIHEEKNRLSNPEKKGGK